MPRLALIFLLLLGACTTTKRSDPLIEEGRVIQSIFRPYHMHDYIVPVTSADAQGHVSVEMRTVTEYCDEQHWVVFACQHGEFAVDKADLWRRMSPGLKVKIRYRQLDTYREENKRLFHVGTDFEFEDAWPAEAEWSQK